MVLKEFFRQGEPGSRCVPYLNGDREPGRKTMTDTTRRAVVFGAGGVGLTAVLAACAGYGAPTDTAAQADSAKPQEPAADGAAGKKLASTGDIPEGGGKIFKSENIVVTQPKAGEFKAFSSTCTHQGCTVESVSSGTINCPCHGSKFKVADGSVAAGPAPKPP